MKTIPPQNPEPDRGPKYWRSLDELAESPSFKPWVEREFPAAASELTDGQSRREFVKVMGASLLLGGLATGCRRPVEKIEPYAKLPEGYLHGVAQYYATSMPTRSGAVPMVVKAHDGRPVKIEGNARFPGGNGGTTMQAQASILDLYDPDRSTKYSSAGASITRERALNDLNGIAVKAAANQGAGLAILAERSSSPSRLRLQRELAAKLPNSKWYVHETGETKIAGLNARPLYHFEKAARILSLDSDFLGTEDEMVRHAAGFAQGRKIAKPGDAMSRLYVVEALMTLTGAAADHRLRKAPSAIPAIALQLAEAIVNGKDSSDKWVSECAKDLLANKGKALVVAGYRQPAAVHALAHAMNAALGAEGQTVTWMPLPQVAEGTIQELATALNGGQVETLVILGGNPAYNAPADLNWSDAQKKAKQVVRVGYYNDETSAISTLHLAEAHYLESWGDTRTVDGRICAVQPLIAPLFSGITQIEVLARLIGSPQTTPHDIVRTTLSGMAGAAGFEEKWKVFLHDGFAAEADLKPGSSGVDAARFFEAGAGFVRQLTSNPTSSSLDVVIYRDSKVDDGRYSNNSWLQEYPDTISKLSWDNVIFLSRKTADELGIKFAVFEGKNIAEHGLNISQKETAANMVPVVTVKVGNATITGPVWIQPGQADNTLAVAMGYGRKTTGRVGRGVGFDANALRTSASPFLAQGAKITATGEKYKIALTQEHWAMEGRPIVREANLATFNETPNFAKALNLEEPPFVKSLYPNPFDDVKKTALHQWGMSIDLNACTGCGACGVACQSENNVPVVGKRQVANGREMHWLRIDRYFTGTVEEPEAVTQPMLCHHCEAAPCENVCPVNATAHDHEGLNVMAYNRCVGTRYCSNNCPYKVRRFNYFDYNKRDMVGGREYELPITTVNKDKSWELINWFKDYDKGNKDSDEWELLKLVKNPEVSVRMRGVMEKCTFCLQRIESAKISQKVKAQSSGDVVVPEGTFTTACAQSCPTQAITFGNVADPNSAVSKEKANIRTYGVLEFLLTKPRVTYLARVRNPNPAMPDAKALPHSAKEYADYMTDGADPFKGHHGAAHKEGGHAEGAHGQPAGEHKGAAEVKKGEH